VVIVIVMFGIVGALNYIAVNHKVRWDLNADKLYTLSDQTGRLLKELKSPVTAVAFYVPEEPEYSKLEDLFDSYAYISKNFQFEFVDYRKRPEAVKAYNVTSTGPRVVLKYEGREARVKDPTEESLTNGLKKVLKTESKKVLFTTGHGEPAIDDQGEGGYSETAKALGGDGFEVTSILLASGTIPADTSVMIVAGPTKTLLPSEEKAISDYLAAGGHVMIMAEPGTDPGMGGLLSQFGISLGNNFVVDPTSKLFGAGASVPVISEYSKHDITKDFKLMTFFPTARSVEVAGNVEGVTVQTIASTGESAWGETDQKEIKRGEVAYDEGKDRKGPVPVAAAASKQITPSAGARLVVFGDGDFANNQFRSLAGNADLFMNAVSWLASQEDNITIRPKNRASSRVFMSQAQADFIKYVTVGPFPPLGVIPLALFAAAFFIWRSRKNK
jgi:ABC-type uncharacterized transport system involved in gliding motility auxiliary subunit